MPAQIGIAARIISVKRQLFDSLRDRQYRLAFVQDRVRSSIALQIRALREQRDRMTQKQLGDALGMAQTWVSKLENPEYGKMTVATLLRLAEAFDTDLEIKFRPFSTTVHTLPTQGEEYFNVPSFDKEETTIERDLARSEARIAAQKSSIGTLAGLMSPEMATQWQSAYHTYQHQLSDYAKHMCIPGQSLASAESRTIWQLFQNPVKPPQNAEVIDIGDLYLRAGKTAPPALLIEKDLNYGT